MSGETDEKVGKPQDALGQSSSKDKSAETSNKKGVLYTDEQIAKIRSDAAAKAGRERKALEVERDELNERFQEQKEELEELRQRLDSFSERDIGDDPLKKRAYDKTKTLEQAERRLREKERELLRKEKELASKLDEFRSEQFNLVKASLSKEYGMTIEEIDDLGIRDLDILKKVVPRIAKTNEKEKQESEKPEEEKEEIPESLWGEPDSGISSFGKKGGKVTAEDIDKMSFKELDKVLIQKKE